MAIVAEEHIQNAVNKINALDEAALNKIAETYTLAQVQLLAYIMEAAEEFENEILADYIIYYFCIISEIYAQAQEKTHAVTEEMIDAFHAPFLELLEEYAQEEDPSILDVLIGQPNITNFIAEDLNGVDEEGEQLEVETASQLFIVLIAVVGLLNTSIR
jgi:hypothetical protein